MSTPTTTRPAVIDIPGTLEYDGTSLRSDHVLALAGSYRRFGIGGIPRGQSGRQVFQGPLVPGPWAFAFGLASVIAANPAHGTYGEIQRNLAANREHTVSEGDLVRFDGVVYEVQITDSFGKRGPVSSRFDFIRLIPVNPIGENTVKTKTTKTAKPAAAKAAKQTTTPKAAAGPKAIPQTLVDGKTAAQRSSETTAKKAAERAAAVEAAKVNPAPVAKAGPPLSADAALLGAVLGTKAAKPTLATVKADTAALRAAGKVPVAKPAPVAKAKAAKPAPVAKAAKPASGAVCSKCGRDNGRPASPDCRNEGACKARRKAGAAA